MVMAARHLRTNFHPGKKKLVQSSFSITKSVILASFKRHFNFHPKKNIGLVKFKRHKKRHLSVILTFILEKKILVQYISAMPNLFTHRANIQVKKCWRAIY